MRPLPNRWNPRVWLRDWLIAPSRVEREQKDAAKARADEAWSSFCAQNDAVRARRAAEHRLRLGSDGRLEGLESRLPEK